MPLETVWGERGLQAGYRNIIVGISKINYNFQSGQEHRTTIRFLVEMEQELAKPNGKPAVYRL